MVGIRDVARKAGVSTSSVSLVINGTGYVSADMRRKVEQAMAELHYVPNALGRNLSRNRTGMIGVIVPTLQHAFFATLVSHIQRELSARGLKTMLCATADADEESYVDMLRRRTMDGIIMGSHTEHDREYWSSIGRPIVAFDRDLGDGVPCVCSDHEQGGNLVADRLADAHHVVMVGGPRRQFHDLAQSTTFPTTRYYVQLEARLDAMGIAHDYVDAGEVNEFDRYCRTMEQVIDSIAQGIGRFADADAIVSSDMGAALAVQYAAVRGIAVPDQLQIVAYDGTYIATLAGQPLSCVQQDFAAIAAALVSDISDLVDGGAAQNVIVPVSWESGATTRR